MTCLYATSEGRITQEYLDESLPALIEEARKHNLARISILDAEFGLMVDYYPKDKETRMRYRHRIHPRAPAERDQYFSLNTEPPMSLDQAYEVATALANIKNPIEDAKKMLVEMVRASVMQLGHKYPK